MPSMTLRVPGFRRRLRCTCCDTGIERPAYDIQRIVAEQSFGFTVSDDFRFFFVCPVSGRYTLAELDDAVDASLPVKKHVLSPADTEVVFDPWNDEKIVIWTIPQAVVDQLLASNTSLVATVSSDVLTSLQRGFRKMRMNPTVLEISGA